MSDLTGVEYLRVSVDGSGRQKSQGEQHVENVAEFADHIAGWADPYVDTGSASRHARRGRDDFARLVADLMLGRMPELDLEGLTLRR